MRSQEYAVVTSSMKDICCDGFSQRAIDVINQCRYLASKKGMSIRELRKSLREDEAKQREYIRQNELKSQMQFVSPMGVADTSGAFCPPWFVNENNHGILYSQYNWQNYGQGFTQPSGPVSMKQRYLPETQKMACKNKTWGCQCNLCRTKWQSDVSSEENLMNQSEPSSVTSITSSEDQDDETLVNLLYSASMDKGSKLKSNQDRGGTELSRVSNRTGGNSGLIESETDFNTRAPTSLGASDSFVTCNLPVRKQASHDLTSLRDAVGDDELSLMGNSDFTVQDDDSTSSDNEHEDEVSELGGPEIQIIEELDKENRVVSPLIQKAETAFASLQRRDSLFGDMDDFGQLMSKANKIF